MGVGGKLNIFALQSDRYDNVGTRCCSIREAGNQGEGRQPGKERLAP